MTDRTEDRRRLAEWMGWRVDNPCEDNRDGYNNRLCCCPDAYFDQNNEWVMFVEDWDPFSSWEHAGLLVDHANACLHLRQHNANGVWEAEFCDIPGAVGEGPTAPAAISEAVLGMLKGEQNGQVQKETSGDRSKAVGRR